MTCLAGGFRFLPRMTWLRMCFLVLGSCKDEVETNTNGFLTVRVGHSDALVLGDMALACLLIRETIEYGDIFLDADEYRS